MPTCNVMAGVSVYLSPTKEEEAKVIPLEAAHKKAQQARRDRYQDLMRKHDDNYFNDSKYKELILAEAVASTAHQEAQRGCYRIGFSPTKENYVHLAGCCGAGQLSSAQSFLSSTAHGINTLISDEDFELPTDSKAFRYTKLKWENGFLYIKELVNKGYWSGDKPTVSQKTEKEAITQIAHLYLLSMGSPASLTYPVHPEFVVPELLIAIYADHQQNALEQWHTYMKNTFNMSPDYVSKGCYNANYDGATRLKLVVYRKD